MNYLELRSAREILQYVARHDGQLTWFNVLRHVDQRGTELTPPSYDVLETLTRLGHLRIDPPGGSNDARYWITPSGQSLLQANPVDAGSTEHGGASTPK